MLDHLLAVGAGAATAASPCILPMLPLVLGASAVPGASAASRTRPLFIVLGFVLSFASAALAFGASLRVLGLSPAGLKNVAIAVMLVAGILLWWPALMERLAARAGGLADAAHRLGSLGGAGAVGGLLMGASLGLLWTPCAGPALASALALVATRQQLPEAFGLLSAYAAGAGLPMLAVAYGGRAITARVRSAGRWGVVIRRVLGTAVIATALAMGAGWDVSAARWLSAMEGNASTGPTSAAAPPASGLAGRPAHAPEFTGITQWFNGPPRRMADLRGRVVLVDFWTHGCINCLNTLPHLRRWHLRYKDRGLAVVGVHTPEFAIERDPAAVQAAIRRWQIDYPVALDNGWHTWTAWRNEYWPAVYLVDRQGRIVFHHVGEGDYDVIEAAIQQALR